ncbi:zinc finger BED domain-containing protein 5-like [Ornithodoros turicata]|uniref:zinc finger BED domain-containing protein 5-like n=1 Tax=Ornithodoros turicata TaxID=34597 RepID=UPI0031399CF8
MSGKHKGLVARAQEVEPSVRWTHCSIHSEALACKGMPSALKDVLAQAVKIVNFIKARPLNSRLFAGMCDEMGSEHKHLLLHTKVRWLSRGKVLARLYELRDEAQIFLLNASSNLSELLLNPSWLASLAYLSDIFESLNELNLSLQGKAVTIFKVHDKVEAMTKKLDAWASRAEKKVFASFPRLCHFLESSEEQMPESLHSAILDHLRSRRKRLLEYFPPLPPTTNWIMNSFQENLENDLPPSEEDVLIELSCDTSLKLKFAQGHLADFWIGVRSEHPALSERALKLLLPFLQHICVKLPSPHSCTSSPSRGTELRSSRTYDSACLRSNLTSVPL